MYNFRTDLASERRDIYNKANKLENGVRIDIWTHFMRGCIIDYVH